MLQVWTYIWNMMKKSQFSTATNIIKCTYQIRHKLVKNMKNCENNCNILKEMTWIKRDKIYLDKNRIIINFNFQIEKIK